MARPEHARKNLNSNTSPDAGPICRFLCSRILRGEGRYPVHRHGSVAVVEIGVALAVEVLHGIS